MTDYERVEKVIRHLEKGYLEQPSLERLARVAGVSEFHFHRLFSRWAGTTPKSFVKALTAAHARELLKNKAFKRIVFIHSVRLPQAHRARKLS